MAAVLDPVRGLVAVAPARARAPVIVVVAAAALQDRREASPPVRQEAVRVPAPVRVADLDQASPAR